jgi:hypothetical protein
MFLVRLILDLGFLVGAMPASYRRTGNKNRTAPTWKSAAQIADGGVIGNSPHPFLHCHPDGINLITSITAPVLGSILLTGEAAPSEP